MMMCPERPEVALLTQTTTSQTMSDHFFARDEYFMRLALREAQRHASTRTCRSARSWPTPAS